MRVRCVGLSIILVAISCLATACRRDDRPVVVVYVSADEHIARQVIDAFEREAGIRVLMVGDSEARKTTGLVERLIAEKNRPQADVFWSSEVFMTIDLAQAGVLREHRSTATADWPKAFRDELDRWYGFAARARVIVYAPDRVPEDQIPRTWMDLTQDRFKNRIVMADPRFGTTGGHLGAMKAYWDREVMPGYFAAFIEGLVANGVRMLPSGNAGVVEAVAKGEADVGMTDTDDVWAAQAREFNVQLIYPSHNVEQEAAGAGTLLIPNTAAIINGAPHPVQAARFMDFLLSERVERMLAESTSHNVPIRAQLAEKYPQYAVPHHLKVDYVQAAAARKPAVESFMHAINAGEHADES